MRVILGSDIVHCCRRPGAFDNRLAYIRGLQQLGHEVFAFTEVNPARCGLPPGTEFDLPSWEGRGQMAALAQRYGFASHYCLLHDQGAATDGMSFARALEVARSADLLINISGKVRTPAIVSQVPCRVFVDLSPGKTQVYQQQYHLDQGLAMHQHFFTVGLNLGTSACDLPAAGVRWQGLLHPVDLDRWPPRIDDRSEAFTSVTNWAGKETFDFDGRYSGEKSDSWMEFIDLPRHTPQALEIAVNFTVGTESNARLFLEHGWRLADPNQWSTPEDYQSFVAKSRGEFSVANQRYVAFCTGWFSDRSARYLATGKPILVQSTGVERHLPTGEGLLTYRTFDEAVAGFERINTDYLRHCQTARRLAEQFFDARKILADLLRKVGA